tara:strand:+ start:443 stop:1525 length:1083 start_codon:yes stop_codon:yes gene_type:complete
MFIRIVLITFYIFIITGCSSSPKQLDKKIYVDSVDSNNSIFEFNQVTDIGAKINDEIFNGLFVIALPDYRRYQEFNNFFQLGIIHAINEHNMENDVEFIFQDEINLNNTTNSFLIGPLSRENVRKIDGSVSKNSALFLNEAESNLYISLGNKSQINVLNKYLDSKKISRIGIISDPQGDKNSEKKFKEFWLNGYRDAITIEADPNMDSENIIKNFLDVSESIERFEKINKASFSKLEFIPRTRDDINQIIIFPKSANRLYELASLIRFNYGLDYEIIALTSELAEKINQNEIELHGISLIDHTYENKFGYDLNKSRSFCLGYDSMLIAYAISNQIKGEVRGLLGTYTISANFIEINSYIN